VQQFNVTNSTMALAALLALGMAIISSLIPAIAAARTSIASTLRDT